MSTFNHEGNYICECGKEFVSANSFNGHKSHCKDHQLAKYGNLNKYNEKRINDCSNLTKCNKNRSLNAQSEKEKNLLIWISEKHTCEKCGKIMTEKYGSGRFCSRSCSNKRNVSEEQKIKTATTLLEAKKSIYSLAPNYCTRCNSALPYEKRNNMFCSKCYRLSISDRMQKRKSEKEPKYSVCSECGKSFISSNKYCSVECRHLGMSKTRKNLFKNGLLDYSNVRHSYHYGTYNNIYCDSSWELAFIMYYMDNSINVVRNTKYTFSYIYNNEEHIFIPDFIVNDTLYEIKGRETEELSAKLQAVPSDINFKILFYDEVKFYIDYAISKYGKDFDKMYDRTKPSWLDKK